LEDAVNIISEAGARLRMPLVIRDTDLIYPEPGVYDPGLSTLLTLGTGNTSTQKFWVASCLMGLLASWLIVPILPMLPSVTGGSEFIGVPAATGRSRQHRSRSTWGLVSRSIVSISNLVSRHLASSGL
jgi:hypothetical protein